MPLRRASLAAHPQIERFSASTPAGVTASGQSPRNFSVKFPPIHRPLSRAPDAIFRAARQIGWRSALYCGQYSTAALRCLRPDDQSTSPALRRALVSPPLQRVRRAQSFWLNYRLCAYFQTVQRQRRRMTRIYFLLVRGYQKVQMLHPHLVRSF